MAKNATINPLRERNETLEYFEMRCEWDVYAKTLRVAMKHFHLFWLRNIFSVFVHLHRKTLKSLKHTSVSGETLLSCDTNKSLLCTFPTKMESWPIDCGRPLNFPIYIPPKSMKIPLVKKKSARLNRYAYRFKWTINNRWLHLSKKITRKIRLI